MTVHYFSLMSENITEVPTLKTVCEILVEKCDATYIAATKQSLANQCIELLIHTSPGSPKLPEVDSRLSNPPESVEVGEDRLPIAILQVLHSDIHAFRRVPLYVDSQPGLDDVALEQGIENARRTLAGKVDCEFSQSKPIELPTLVEELANEGAAAVELRNEMLVRFDVVDLRIPMVPAEGYPIAGLYDSVTINGQEYDFRFDCTLDGPGGYGWMRTPLYVDESTLGLPAVPVEAGIKNLEEVQTIVEKSDSPDEAFEKLPSDNYSYSDRFKVGDTIKIDDEKYEVEEKAPVEYAIAGNVVEAYYIRDEDNRQYLYVVREGGETGRELHVLDAEEVEEYAVEASSHRIKQEFDEVADIRIGTEPERNIADNWPQVQIYERSEADDWYFVEFESGDFHEYESVEKDEMAYVVDQFLTDPIMENINLPGYDDYTFEEFVRVKRDRIGAASRLLDAE